MLLVVAADVLVVAVADNQPFGYTYEKKNPLVRSPSNSSLLLACKSRRMGVAIELIRHGAKVNVANGEGETPLTAAAARGLLKGESMQQQ